MRQIAVAGVVLGLAVSLSGQTTPEERRFEVASIKPSPATFGGYYSPQPTRFTTTSSVFEMVRMAYQLPHFRIVGGEDWTRSQRWDVNASITGPRTPGDLWFMLRNLLTDRFNLRLHREQRPVDVFVLMLVRADGTLGPNVTRVNRACPQNPDKPEDRCSTSEAVGTYRSTGLRWENKTFVDFLERVAGRPVVDRTGLSGQFDLSLRFNPNIQRPPEGRTDVSLAELEERPTIFTALREQFGLKLEPAREPVDVIVIDSVQRPTLD
jgi:uncharacterized protein (TIGR03435 family)